MDLLMKTACALVGLTSRSAFGTSTFRLPCHTFVGRPFLAAGRLSSRPLLTSRSASSDLFPFSLISKGGGF